MLSNNYILILLWIAAMALLSKTTSVVYCTETVNGQRVRRFNWFFAILAVLPLVIWAGWRGYIGDTASYMTAFKDMPAEFGSLINYISGIEKDKGFYFFSALIKCIIGNHVHIYFLMMAALQCLLVFMIYRKYSISYIVSFFLFIVSTDYISWIFNGMRQFTAAAITFACFPLIVKKKYLWAIIGVLFASLFHQSALLVIPFIFIAQGKAWNKKTLLFIGASIVAVLFIDRFTNILDTVLADTQYKNVVSDWQSWEDDGTNVLRVLVYSVPALMSLVGLKFVRHADDPIINLCVNMSIVSMGFYIISMFTSGIFIGRLPIYFSLYSYILLPWLIKNMFEKRSEVLVNIGMVGAYLVFYYYQVRMAWGLF